MDTSQIELRILYLIMSEIKPVSHNVIWITYRSYHEREHLGIVFPIAK